MSARAWLAMCLCVSSVALAQGAGGVILGTVVDASTNQPVADVVVTATSPAYQGEAIVVTDNAGFYRIPQLPPGAYEVRFEKESHHAFKRPEITLRADHTLRLNVQLQPLSLESERIDIQVTSPVVDVGATSTGITVTKEFIEKVGFMGTNGNGVRSFDAVASVSPQVSADTYGFGYSGAQSPENLYLVDGVSTSDPAFGTNGAQFPVEFLQEANVITGGYQAEYGRATGGVLSVVTKSGSNEFHGSVWGNWTPGALSGVSPEIKNDASVFVNRTRLWNTVDFGADLGGPIVKDRLWFYVGVSPSFNRVQQTQSMRRFVLNDDRTDFVYDSDGYIETKDLPDTTKQRFVDIRTLSYLGKLTFLLNSDNSISLSVVGSPTTADVPFSFIPGQHFGSWNGGFSTQTMTNTVSLNYQGGFLDKHLLIDAGLGWFHIGNQIDPTDGSKVGDRPGLTATGAPLVIFRRTAPHSILDFDPLNPAAAAQCEAAGTVPTATTTVRGQERYLMACPTTGGGQVYAFGGLGSITNTALDRLSARLSITYLAQALGHHILKAGLDIERLSYDINKAFSGGVVMRENTSGSAFSDFRQYGFFTSPDTAQTQLMVHAAPTSTGIGAYVQDSWSILDMVTLNAGLRYETQQLFAADGTLGLSLNNEISPRIGLIYDFTQQGRSKVYASYSRFYEAMPIDIADRALTGENQYQFSRSRAANSTRQGCDPIKDFNQVFNECKDPNNYRTVNGEPDVNKLGLQTGAGKTPIDPNIEPQSSDEIVAGGEYEVMVDGRVGVSYTKRWMNRVIEDMSLDESSTYFIGNPGYGLATAFPKAVRDYDGVTASFTKAYSNGWLAQASYTWSSLRGNYNGLFRPENAQLDPNINSDFDLISLLANRTGPLGANRTHFIKLYATKEFLLTNHVSLLLSLSYNGSSGTPINYTASHPLYGANESFVLPRGSGGELPWQHTFNAKVGVSYRFTKDTQVQFTADVLNFLNLQAVTAVDQTLSSSDILPYIADPTKNAQVQTCLAGKDSPACQNGVTPLVHTDHTPVLTSELNSNFKRPTAYQAPISVRFGVRFTF